uniref:Uncharacterized protein n=1 Tax=Cacopsylla melanoneura TaxID=428564 RepID=A0A8D8TSP3_9HEMI
MSSPPQCFDSFLGLSLQTGMIIHCVMGFTIDIVYLLLSIIMSIMLNVACRRNVGLLLDAITRIIVSVVLLLIVRLGERIHILVHVVGFVFWFITTVVVNMVDVVLLIVLLVDPSFQSPAIYLFGTAACHSMYILQFVLLLMSVVIFCSGTFVYWSYYKENM